MSQRVAATHPFRSRFQSSCLLVMASLGVLGFSRPAAAQFGPTPAFSAATNLPLSSNPMTVSVADLNNDGKLDLVIPVNAAGGILVLLGNGDGTFTQTTAPGVVIPTGSFPESTAVGLVNADAFPDIVVGHFGPALGMAGTVAVLLGDGLGGFTPGFGSPLTSGINTFGVAIGRINNDAFPDIVAVNQGTMAVPTSSTVSVFLGSAVGFGAKTDIVVGPGPRDVAIADLNNDTFNDIITTNFNQNAGTVNNDVSVLLSLAGAGFAAPAPYTTAGGARTLVVTNLNGDAFQDVVVANSDPSTISVLLGQAGGTLTLSNSYLTTAGGAVSGMAAGDFNLDGKLDIVAANSNLTTAQIFSGNGAGLLQAALPLTAGTSPSFVGAGDFNGDGKPDLAVTNYGGGNVSIFLNNLALSADLGVTKVKTSPATLVAGQNVVYTTTVTNTGPNSAVLTSVADPTPTGLAFVSNAGACTTAFPCALGTLTPGGAPRVITSTFLVQPGAGASVTNTATVSSSAADPAAGNNTSAVTSAVTFSADLSVTKVKASPATVVAGQQVVYTITVTNAGPSNAAAVQVTDTPGAGLTFVSNAGACTGLFPCALGSMAPGTQVITSTYLVQASAGASITNTANVASTGGTPTPDPNAANNTSAVTTPVTFSADLSVTKVKASPATVVAGQNVVYTITVTNAGPSNAAAVQVTDTPGAGLTFVSNAGACTGLFPCSLGTMAPGTQVITSTYLVQASAGASITNTANVASTGGTPTPDPNAANNTSAVTTPVTFSADLSITKVGPAIVTAGDDAVYTITVTNNGPSDAVLVRVTDPTPGGGVTFVSNSGGGCVGVFPCTIGTVVPGTPRVITSTFNVPLNFAGANVANTASVASTGGTPTPDPNNANNSSTATTPVGPASADLSITKVGPAKVFRGTPVVYTITVTNNGPTGANAVQVVDPTPTGLNFVSNSGDCITAFPCNLGGVPNGATRTITATFDIPTSYAGPEPVANTATVSSTTTDTVASNDSATSSAPLDRVSFNTLEPCRVLDTRDAAGPLGGPALVAGAIRSFTITGNCTVPSTARSVSVNITVTGPTDPGDLRIYPTGSTLPDASVINYGAGQTRANNAVIPLGTGGALDVFCEQAAGTVDFILDVNGYFEP